MKHLQCQSKASPDEAHYGWHRGGNPDESPPGDLHETRAGEWHTSEDL